MKRLKLITIAAALLLLAAPAAMAQAVPDGMHGTGDGYGPDPDTTYPQEVQTTTSPVGTAVEPGSQLLFLLDSGVDATDCQPDQTLQECGFDGPEFTNFISITNVNPTDAVTVHFRYFNEDCTDLLDFLVVLTCNDTMLINPFDYTIPGSTTNVSQRFFGDEGVFPEPIVAPAFGTGRFALFVQASGAVGNESGDSRDTGPNGADTSPSYEGPEDLDKFADWLFPARLISEGLLDECWAVDDDTIGSVPAGGSSVNNNNLNVFNASAISFNYLTGFHTVAAIRDNGLASFGVTAWTRPAVNLSFNDLDPEDTSFDNGLPNREDNVPDFSAQDVVGPAPTMGVWDPDKDPDGVFDFFDLYNILDAGLDGDGPLAPKRCVLSGSEEIWLTLQRDSDLVLPANYFYLRQDAHGGDTVETNCEGLTLDSDRCDGDDPFFATPVSGGALGWTLFPGNPNDQFLFGASLKDDYNGSGNPNNLTLSLADDSAYRMDAAATYYELAIYNCDEDILDIPREIEDISPAPPFTPLVTRVALRCLNYYAFANGSVGSVRVGPDSTDFIFTRNFGTFSVADLFSLAPPLVENFLPDPPVCPNDELGPGWIRFNRIVTRDYWYDQTSGALIGFGEDYDGERGTYVTIAKHIIFQSAFGVSWYVPQAATEFDPGVN